MVNYISQCMQSVISQTLKNIEILIIDAGSTDGTREILEEYALKDDRIHIVLSDKKSYGYQVNMGIALAKGEYVGIVDTDDYIMPEMYEKLYNCAKMYDLHYCKGMSEAFVDIHGYGRLTQPMPIFGDNEKIIDKIIVPGNMPELLIKDCYLWNGIYQRDFIKNIKLNETPGAAYQDLGFIFQAYSTAQKAMYINDVLYYYRKDNINASGYDKRAFSHLVKEYEYVEKLLQEKEEKWISVIYEKMLLHCYSHLSVLACGGELEEALPDIEILRKKLDEANRVGLFNKRKDPELDEMFQLFTKDVYGCYKFYKDELGQRRIAVRNLMKTVSGKHIVIFGAGRLGQFIHIMMLYDGQEKIEAYCDNNCDIQGSKIYQVPVLSPKEAVDAFSDAYFLIANKSYLEQMKQQLLDLKIAENRIYLYHAGASSISFYQYFIA